LHSIFLPIGSARLLPFVREARCLVKAVYPNWSDKILADQTGRVVKLRESYLGGTQKLISPKERMKTEMARVVVIGTSCVGKTTFARSLARVLSCPHVELDALHWQPNWTPRPPEGFRALTADALAQDYWIIDGNYGTVRDLVWSRATTVIWLNYSFPIVMWRALTRTIRRVLTQEELFSGNRESLRMAFLSRESILWWVITTFHRRRRQYRQLFDTATISQLAYVEFRSPSEARNFLRGIGTTLQTTAAINRSQTHVARNS
jgi:adenylate kinase family enzyme